MDTPYVHLCIKNRILVGTYKPKLKIDLEVAKAIVSARQTFTKTEKFATLIISKGVISMSRQAREYLSSPEATEGLTASAIVVDSLFSSFLGNFFIAVNQTSIPVKIFASTPDAEKWLQKFII